MKLQGWHGTAVAKGARMPHYFIHRITMTTGRKRNPTLGCSHLEPGMLLVCMESG